MHGGNASTGQRVHFHRRSESVEKGLARKSGIGLITPIEKVRKIFAAGHGAVFNEIRTLPQLCNSANTQSLHRSSEFSEGGAEK